MGEQWRPWRELRERAEIEFSLADLPEPLDALWVRRGADRVILISRKLTPVERLAALAHELVHDERGMAPAPPPPHPLSIATAREEARVDRIAVSRLVPIDELRRFVAARVDVEGGIEPWQVAEEFEVPDDYAELALRLLSA